ncbi:MAG: hypothetical protein WEG36_12185 [Gemmatimonadota bacterium]
MLTVVGLVLLGGCVPPEESESGEEQVESTETSAEDLFAVLRQSQELPGLEWRAVAMAEELIARFSGTPLGDSASAMIADLRAREAAAAQAEEEAREAERLAAKWSYSVSQDPMTSRETRTATISSENTVNFAFPYQGEQRGTLTLRDHPTFGRDIIFRIERGQLLCTSYSGCRVRIRFDEGAAQSWEAVGPSDNSSESLFMRNYDGFLPRLREADVVLVQAEAYQEGSPIFEFRVGGFDFNRYSGR